MKKIIIGLLMLFSLVLVACGPTDTLQEVRVNQPVVLLAGTTTPYQEFTQSAYEEALAQNKKIFLMWYATWCPSCRAEQKIAQPYFDSLNDPNIIGFRVNFKDKNTDANEEALARKFGVSTQSTKVYLINGEKVHKTPKHYISKEEYSLNFKNYFEVS